MEGHLEQAEALAVAEQVAVRALGRLSGGCEYQRILTGFTKRGPASVYLCATCSDISVISFPAGGLRNREPDAPTSRTRIATFRLPDIVLETGAFIESDGTTRARFVIHLPGHPEPEWDITTDQPEAVGAAVQAIRTLRP